MIAAQTTIAEWIHLVRSEYLEIPGLHLTRNCLGCALTVRSRGSMARRMLVLAHIRLAAMTRRSVRSSAGAAPGGTRTEIPEECDGKRQYRREEG